MTIKTKTADETKQIGRELAERIKSGGVLCLYGDLGAGKTTLTQGLAEGLGIASQIVSPTFILMRQYKLPENRTLYHIDLYRLNDLEEIKAIGIEEILENKDNVVVMEWPEKIAELLPKNRWEAHLVQTGESEREIKIDQLP